MISKFQQGGIPNSGTTRMLELQKGLQLLEKEFSKKSNRTISNFEKIKGTKLKNGGIKQGNITYFNNGRFYDLNLRKKGNYQIKGQKIVKMYDDATLNGGNTRKIVVTASSKSNRTTEPLKNQNKSIRRTNNSNSGIPNSGTARMLEHLRGLLLLEKEFQAKNQRNTNTLLKNSNTTNKPSLKTTKSSDKNLNIDKNSNSPKKNSTSPKSNDSLKDSKQTTSLKDSKQTTSLNNLSNQANSKNSQSSITYSSNLEIPLESSNAALKIIPSEQPLNDVNYISPEILPAPTKTFLQGVPIAAEEFNFHNPSKYDFDNLYRGLRNQGYGRLKARRMMRNSDFYSDLINQNQEIFNSQNKFQQGGKMENQQLEMVFNALNLNPQETIIQLVKNGVTPEQLGQLILIGVQQNKISLEAGQQAIQVIQEIQQQQTRMAKHGAKLNYVKQLKNQCPEGYELQYFKQGGNVDCGCVKKNKDGGKQEPKKQTAADKFKAMKAQRGTKAPKKLDEAARDSILANKYNDQEVQTSKPGKYINGVWTPDRTKAPYAKNKNDKNLVGNYNSAKAREQLRKNREESKRGVPANLDKCGGKMKKKENGGTFKKKGSIKVAACGSKVKKHQEGGSLNGVPFYQEGGKSRYNEFSGWDLVPYVGTYRDIVRAYDNPNTRNIVNAGLSVAGDAFGLGILGSTAKSLSKYNRITKALKSRGFFRPTNVGTDWLKITSKPGVVTKPGYINNSIQISSKSVPEVDLAAPIMWGISATPARVVKTGVFYEL